MDTTPSTDGRFDVVGIGNALVDVISHETDEFVDRLGVPKGAMALIEEDRATSVYDSMGAAIEISGGSAANTIVGVASLGGRAAYLGKVRDDQLGEVFAHDLRATGVSYDVAPAVDGPATGRCLVVVTPDAQRTMSTYLGASAGFGPEDVDLDAIAAARVLYLEGYLFDPPAAQAAFQMAARHARSSGTTVALTLSDAFCVERHHEAFADMVHHHVDVLFANEVEALTLFGAEDLDEVVHASRRAGTITAITRSERGSVVVSDDGVEEVPAHPVVELVDTTGAGDLYAAGFLFGLSRDLPLGTCAALGSMAASEVISHVGARPQADLAAAAADLLAG